MTKEEQFDMTQKVMNLMLDYPVTVADWNSREHALHALELALADQIITRQDYEELRGFTIHVLYKDVQS